MKVALIEIWRHGGTAQYAAELARGLYASKAESDEIHLIVPTSFSYTSSEYQLHKVLPELTGAKVGGKLGNVASLSWLRTRQAARACQELDKIKPQVVHVLGTSAVSKKLINHVHKLNAKLVVTVHDLPLGKGWSQLLYNFWSKHFTSADHIIVHGKWSKSQVESEYGDEAAKRTSVMPLGLYDYGIPSCSLEESRHRFNLPQDKSVILFFGSLRRNKGLETLIEALALETSRKAHLFVAGQRPAKSEPPVEWYQELAREKGVADKITWLIRYVEDREVADIFSCVNVVALPYMKSFAAQSSVLSVAAAYSVPVVASDVGDIGTTVREYGLGLCVEPESPPAFAALINSLLSSKRAWDNKRSREFAQYTNWTNIGRQHWALYRNGN